MDYSKIYVAGHNGLAGGAIVRALFKETKVDIITSNRGDLDLEVQIDTLNFLKETQPDVVIIAAAKVGGIQSNIEYGAEFLYRNLTIGTNLIHGAYLAGVKRLIYLSSNCVYPIDSTIPINEECLLTGGLQSTNEPYALAKISMMKMCEEYSVQYGLTYHSILPSSLYGPGDNYNIQDSHVMAAIIRKIHEARSSNSQFVTLWGTGNPRREFLYVDDMASACLRLLEIENPPLRVNLGVNTEISIKDLANLIKDTLGYLGSIKFDESEPEGVQSKLLDSTKIRHLGWMPKVSLKEGIGLTYKNYKQGILDETIRL